MRQFSQTDSSKQMTTTREVEVWMRSPQARRSDAASRTFTIAIEKNIGDVVVFQSPRSMKAATNLKRRNITSEAIEPTDLLQKVQRSINRVERALKSQAETLPQDVTIKIFPSAQKNRELLSLLKSWNEAGESEVQEQSATWDYLREALDEDRSSDRKLFPTATETTE